MLIGLALAHEMLKSINMFEHDTSFWKILWCWLLSSGRNLISSTFAWFEPLLTFKGYCFFAFGIVRKWDDAKEWLRHWIPLIYFSSFFFFVFTILRLPPCFSNIIQMNSRVLTFFSQLFVYFLILILEFFTAFKIIHQ